MDVLEKKVGDFEKNLLDKYVNNEKFQEKDIAIDNIVDSMLEKFRKLEVRLYNLEDRKSDECENSEIVQRNLEDRVISIHEMTNVLEIEKSSSGIYNCSFCDFTTAHHPGFKCHVTKMHGEKVKYPCDQCEETFDSKKKLKNHIYCIHSGKYKTLAQLIDEAVP